MFAYVCLTNIFLLIKKTKVLSILTCGGFKYPNISLIVLSYVIRWNCDDIIIIERR